VFHGQSAPYVEPQDELSSLFYGEHNRVVHVHDPVRTFFQHLRRKASDLRIFSRQRSRTLTIQNIQGLLHSCSPSRGIREKTPGVCLRIRALVMVPRLERTWFNRIQAATCLLSEIRIQSAGKDCRSS